MIADGHIQLWRKRWSSAWWSSTR